ncbi:MAG: shikimate kinase AroL [Desulfonatronovibrio sp. MSAO_Bac4]|nr:MAG: shikimate kinase AroL [Desulfonatronovibrio sp. MSAO_Bac4]
MKVKMRFHNIYLIGYRACGKTTLARRVAESSGLKFLDTDQVIQENSHMSIDEMVSSRGWDYFRDIEEKTLADTALIKGMVVATGGGVILRESNREILKEDKMLTVYLQADADLVLSRLSSDPNPKLRPALSKSPLTLEVMNTLTERESLYLECADLILDAARPVENHVQRILNLI